MSDTDGVKVRLHAILSQKFKKFPEYEYTPKPSARGGPRFVCELTVEGFNYVAVGNSTSKKDAQTNAAKEFFTWLFNNKHITQEEMPSSVLSSTTKADGMPPPQLPPMPKPAPFKGGELPENNYFARNQGPHMSSSEQNEFFDEQKMIEAEECDFTSDIHGNWTLSNCKARLNEYMQSTKQNLNQIVYSHSGPDHNRSYIAELKIYAKKCRKQLFAREEGSNKQIASRALCLSLVRQLYHAGEIEAFNGPRKSNKTKEIPFTEVKLREDLSERLAHLIQTFALEIPQQPAIAENEDGVGVDIGQKNINPEYIPPSINNAARPIKWAPPLCNWNPWTAANIDSGPYSTMSLDEISYEISCLERQKVGDESYTAASSFRQNLPVFKYQNEILNVIGSNQVTLVRGETGCGKTTQIPQFILDSYVNSMKGAECSILVTQPRRISAISLAERVSCERAEQLGQSIGYCVRFETVFPRPYGSILFCTVGTLARKMESGLRGISHIIIDEIHERDVNTDFLLILVKDMVLANPELRVVLMSATIDVTMFQDYFPGCHMLDLVGRSYPVQTYFLEDCIKLTNFTNVHTAADSKSKKRKKNEEDIADDQANNKSDKAISMKYAHEYPDFVQKVMSNIVEHYVQFDLIVAIIRYIVSLNVPGAILIFLPGWNLISMLKNHLGMLPEFSSSEYLVLPLHSQVPREEQKLVFRRPPERVRKIVIATNIAESSITIDDVVFVIDSCLARQKNFNFRNNMTSFSTTWASKTNLEQRRGRAPALTLHEAPRHTPS